MRKIELKQLEYFLAVAENLSFTKAAEEIHVAQPAISQQIKQLERDLGISLFHRNNKRVNLTEAGQLFRKKSLEVLEHVDAAIKVIEELRGLERGTVSIGMSSTMATVLMSDLVKEFQTQFPHIKIKISESITSESLHRVKDSELDIAIVSLPIPQNEENNLQAISLYEEELEAIVPFNHPLAKENIESINLIELNKYQWILANNSNTLRRLINECCEEKGFCPIVKMEVDRVSAVKSLLISSELGVTILTPTSVSYELSLGLVKKIKLKDISIRREVGIVSRPHSVLPPATIEMINVIKQLGYNYPEVAARKWTQIKNVCV